MKPFGFFTGLFLEKTRELQADEPIKARDWVDWNENNDSWTRIMDGSVLIGKTSQELKRNCRRDKEV